LEEEYATPLVASKGGIEDLELKPMGTTWTGEFIGHNVYRREDGVTNKKTSISSYQSGSQTLENKQLGVSETLNYGEAKNGLRIVTNKDYLKIQKDVKNN